MNTRLIHDAAYAMATALVDIIGPCLREEERLDAFQEMYQVCKAGVEAYHLHEGRMQHHLNPSRN